MPIEALVPDGFESLVRARPDVLFSSPATRAVIDAVVPSARVDAFRDRHGVDPRSLETLVVATYPDAEVAWLARGAFHASIVVGEIGHRMTPLESSAERPVMRRAGTYLARRFELLALGPHEVALVDGSPALAGRIASRLRAESEAPAPARERSLIDAASSAPLFYLHRGPFGLPPEGIGLVLSRLEDLTLTLGPDATDPAWLVVEARLLGDFPTTIEENLRAFLGSLAESELGQALGIAEAARALEIARSDGDVQLRARLRASTLSRGLRVLFGAEIDEMMGAPG